MRDISNEKWSKLVILLAGTVKAILQLFSRRFVTSALLMPIVLCFNLFYTFIVLRSKKRSAGRRYMT